MHHCVCLYVSRKTFHPNNPLVSTEPMMQSKKQLSEADIRAKFITPDILKAGWKEAQIGREVFFTDGKIIVKGRIHARGKRKRADYILYLKPNIPIAVVEAKDNNHSIGSGMQQALAYAKALDILFVFSSNGDGFVFHNKAAEQGEPIERELSPDEFPSPDTLWRYYKRFKNIGDEDTAIVLQDYFVTRGGRTPRYYQQIAINKTIEAIAQGQQRILLTMATGTGKTYTAFNIIYRLWKSGTKKRILFLADRTALIDQTRRGDFRHFGDKMTVIKKKVVTYESEEGVRSERLVSNNKRGIDSADKAYEIFLGLYQGLVGQEGMENPYEDFSEDFFDLVIIDECHRGSAREDSEWRKILTYFSSATHIGLTATPKETKEVSNIEYFGDSLYTYSLKQGIDDGFLAPYKVIRVGLNVDLEGWRPERNKKDKYGNLVTDRKYNTKDYDKNLVIEERTKIVAKKVTEFLKGAGRFNKTIVFCVDINHAERMRKELINCNTDLYRKNAHYIMQITGDNAEGKLELDNFTNPEEKYPVIVTTSKLLTTGIDAKTCKLIVLDSNIQSMTEFKQIIGRGTRIDEEYDKFYFTILDFRNVTDLFADPKFDDEPVMIKVATEDTDLSTAEDEGGEDIGGNEDGTENGNEEENHTGNVSDSDAPEYEKPKLPNAGEIENTRQKIYVNGIDVTVLVERELQFDHQGKLVTKSLKVYTEELIKEKYASLQDFLNKWTSSKRKLALVEELKKEGVLVKELQSAVDKNVDIFDLICHVAYDMPPLTRKERANNVKKRNYFTKYGEQARKVLENLLEKYADEGIENMESTKILRLKPFNEIGTLPEIVNGIFGGKENYFKAVKELEAEIYRTA